MGVNHDSDNNTLPELWRAYDRNRVLQALEASMRQSEMPTTRGGPGQQGETSKARAHNDFHAGSSRPTKGNDQEKGQEKDNSQELEYARKTL